MASRCLGRRTNERLLFGDGKHYFYTEERCKRKTAGSLCTVCDGGAALEHGIVSEGIPPLSHIYGSAWYDLKRTVYGDPSSQDMAKAKKAQGDASVDASTDATASKPEVIATANATATPTPSSTEKKKRTFKIAAPAIAAIAVTETPTTAAVKVKRQPKKVVTAQIQTVSPLATESTEPPLQDLPCIVISVRRYEHNGRKYYLNSDKDKLYTVQPDGGVGKYCGRLDRENDRIADFPDSDSER